MKWSQVWTQGWSYWKEIIKNLGLGRGQTEVLPSLPPSCVGLSSLGALAAFWKWRRVDEIWIAAMCYSFWALVRSGGWRGRDCCSRIHHSGCITPFWNLSSSTSKSRWDTWKTRPGKAPASASIFTRTLPARCEPMRENKHGESERLWTLHPSWMGFVLRCTSVRHDVCITLLSTPTSGLFPSCVL